MISVPIDNHPRIGPHFFDRSGSNSIQLGIASSSLHSSIQSQTRQSVKARAEPRCSATLQCSLSSSTVSQPTAPCQTINISETRAAFLDLEEDSLSDLITIQFSMTRGPRTAPASSRCIHSVKIWKEVYLCPEPLESASSGFSSHQSPCSSSEISNPKVPKHVGQSGPVSYTHLTLPTKA